MCSSSSVVMVAMATTVAPLKCQVQRSITLHPGHPGRSDQACQGLWRNLGSTCKSFLLDVCVSISSLWSDATESLTIVMTSESLRLLFQSLRKKCLRSAQNPSECHLAQGHWVVRSQLWISATWLGENERFTGIQNCGKTINQTCNKGSQAILRKVNPAQKQKKLEELPRFYCHCPHSPPVVWPPFFLKSPCLSENAFGLSAKVPDLNTLKMSNQWSCFCTPHTHLVNLREKYTLKNQHVEPKNNRGVEDDVSFGWCVGSMLIFRGVRILTNITPSKPYLYDPNYSCG